MKVLGTVNLLFMIVMIYSLSFAQSIQKEFDVPESGVRVKIISENSYNLSNGAINKNYSNSNLVRLRFREFDPLKLSPEKIIPAIIKSDQSLRKSNSESSDQVYLIQFYTQAFPGYQKEISNLGGEVFSTIPDNSLLVLINTNSLEEIKKLPYVRWAGIYEPVYKLEPEIIDRAINQESTENKYSILVHKSSLQSQTIDFINSIGGQALTSTSSKRFEAVLNGEQLLMLSKRNEIEYIDRWTEIEDDMDIVRELHGANFIETFSDYTGHGVRGEVLDDGVRYNHTDFKYNPPLIHTSNNADDNHGTSVYGIVFGSGAGNPNAKGLLPDAEQPIFSSNHHLSDRYVHTQELVDPNGNFRAVFQTNSWGNTQTLDYTTISAEMDQILFDNDITILQSQSNEGDQNSRPQAWAKNILSIGGFRHHNTISRSDDEWNGSASIGPAKDGRIKPDLSNFYDNTLTTSSTGNNDYKNFGGTSGATPITAGYVGLFYEMWADGVFDGGPGKNRDVFESRPHMTTAKAILINSAYQYNFNSPSSDMTRVHQGWGSVNIKNLYQTAQMNGWKLPIIVNETDVLTSLQEKIYKINTDGSRPLKVSLVYADPAGSPASTKQLVNNLSIKVTSPSNIVYWGNNGLLVGKWSTSGGVEDIINNVENVFVESPEVGEWTIKVIASEIVVDSHIETPGIDADYALVATGGWVGAKPAEYNLTINKVGSGSISQSVISSTYFAGSQVTLIAKPANGYRFVNWSGDVNSSDVRIFVTMNGNKNVIANFEVVPAYSINITNNGNGTVSINPASGPYYQGSEVTLLANPATGQQFDSWSGDITSNDNPVSFIINSDKNITANYSVFRPTLEVTKIGSGNVNINPSQVDYSLGSNVQLTATPDAGYSFVAWEGDVSSSDNPLSLTMDNNKNIKARFSGYKTLPYSTGFETGVLDYCWLKNLGVNGDLEITGNFEPHESDKHLIMSVDKFNQMTVSDASLLLNLNGESNVELTFWFKDFDDEHQIEDGVFFSDNGGSSFVKVFDLDGANYTNNEWNEIILNVDQLTADNGLSLTSTFIIKFQHSDEYPIPSDGFAFDDIEVLGSGVVSVQNNGAEEIPDNFKLYDAFPNPFNPTTTIRYFLSEDSYIKLIVFDLLGKKVETIFEGDKSKGFYQVQFNASNLNSGIYFYQLVTKKAVFTKKMLLMK